MAKGGPAGIVIQQSTVVEELVVESRCEGRLTAASGQPIPTGLGFLGATLYFTPYKGDHISLFVGGAWRDCTFSEISISNAGLANITLYDVFAFWNGSVVELEFSAAWADYTTRTDAIAYQDGVAVKATDHTRRLIGTVEPASAGNHTPPFLFIDVINARYISNLYNAVPLPCQNCIPYVDDGTLQTFDVNTPGGVWKIPLFLGGTGIPNYFDVVLVEPRRVRASAVLCMKNLNADVYGGGIGFADGDENWDITTFKASARTSLDELQTNVPFEVMMDIGGHVFYIGFFAQGSGETCTVLVNDERHGATKSPFLTYISGTVEN